MDPFDVYVNFSGNDEITKMGLGDVKRQKAHLSISINTVGVSRSRGYNLIDNGGSRSTRT